MSYPEINTKDVSARFEPETGYVWVAYRGSLTASMTVDVYRWMVALAKHIKVTDVLGSVYDFTGITDFSRYSLSTVQRESHNLNMNMDMSHIPVALIVANDIQKSMVRIGLQLTPQEHRKRIVMSEEEALAFFTEWHNNQSRAT